MNIIGFNKIRPRKLVNYFASALIQAPTKHLLYNFHHCNKLQYLYKAPEDKASQQICLQAVKKLSEQQIGNKFKVA